jgi:hypothetical protein
VKVWLDIVRAQFCDGSIRIGRGRTGNNDTPLSSNNARQNHLLPSQGARGLQGREGGR